jgi:Leucine-rich repeat (LRR) protein
MCYQNQLAALPTLPASLEILVCCQNLLTALPPLPPALQTFHFTRNNLTEVPVIRSRLLDILCEGNRFGEQFERIATTFVNPADAIVAYHAIQKGRNLMSLELSISKRLPCDVLAVIGSFLSGKRCASVHGQRNTLRSCVESIRHEQNIISDINRL